MEGVTLSEVDEHLNPIPGSEKLISCDTVLLSCGLIPENELTLDAGAVMDEVTQGPIVNDRLETTERGIFACGNVLHVHDLVDNVSKEAQQAGAYAAEYIRNKKMSGENRCGRPFHKKRNVRCLGAGIWAVS